MELGAVVCLRFRYKMENFIVSYFTYTTQATWGTFQVPNIKVKNSQLLTKLQRTRHRLTFFSQFNLSTQSRASEARNQYLATSDNPIFSDPLVSQLQVSAGSACICIKCQVSGLVEILVTSGFICLPIAFSETLYLTLIFFYIKLFKESRSRDEHWKSLSSSAGANLIMLLLTYQVLRKLFFQG